MSKLRKLRKQNKLTQQELADLIDVSRTTIGEIENGTNKPSIKNARKLADLLGVEWYELYDDCDD